MTGVRPGTPGTRGPQRQALGQRRFHCAQRPRAARGPRQEHGAAIRRVHQIPRRHGAALDDLSNVQELLIYLSPLGWEHVKLTGDYIWAAHHSVSEYIDGMRPLRLPSEPFAKAA